MSAASDLDPVRLIEEARRETGLHDFDDPSIEEPLGRLTRALRTEANLNATGVYIWHARLLNTLMTRLRANDWFRRHPEIADEQLPPAVVILGLARTGTTLLHRLLAADSRFYSAAWWECRFPVPAEGDLSGEQRKAAAIAEVAAILQAQPELAAIHPWDALGADEDIMLIDQTLLSTTAESLACIPSYREWIHGQDLRPAYSYLLKLMQFLQWQKKQRGEPAAGRWVLKTPIRSRLFRRSRASCTDSGPAAAIRRMRTRPVTSGARRSRSISTSASRTVALWRASASSTSISATRSAGRSRSSSASIAASGCP
jgi:hypothetical protein